QRAPLGEQVGEGAAGGERHDDGHPVAVGHHVEDPHDVGVVEVLQHGRLGPQPVPLSAARLVPEPLDRHHLTEAAAAPRPPHLRAGAAAHPGDQVEVTQALHRADGTAPRRTAGRARVGWTTGTRGSLSPMSIRGRPRTVALAPLLVLALGAGCGDDDSADPTTSTTAATTTTEDAAAAEEAAVLAAYETHWAGFVAAIDPPDPDAEALAEHTGG